MQCRLCRNKSNIVESHIIPKFVAKWLKDSSATGYIRQAVNPNLRKQDFPTIKLLCADCEERFSLWEKRFAEAIFFPFHKDGQKKFEYDNWLLSFAVSLSWRVGTVELENFRKLKPNLVAPLEEALSNWSAFLLGKSPVEELYEHHILFLGFVVDSTDIKLPEGFHWYILRSIDATLPANSSEVAVYTKLPCIVFFSGVQPSKLTGWKSTQIFQRGTIETASQEVRNIRFGEFLKYRVIEAGRASSAMSEKQEKIVSTTMLKDPDRTIKSRSFEVNFIDWYWEKK